VSLQVYVYPLHAAIANRYTVSISRRRARNTYIKAPDEKLKLLQKKLSDVLQNCLEEINTAKGFKAPWHTGLSGSARSSRTPHNTITAAGCSTSI